MTRRSVSFFLLVIVLAGCLRIAPTWHQFSPAIDESVHIGTGFEYLDLGSFNLEPMHPPLGRVAGALGPYLYGYRLPESHQQTECDTPFIDEYFHIKETVKSGYFDFACLHKVWHSLLWQDGRFQENLALARAGTLIFFIGACIFTFLLAKLFTGSAGLGLVAAGLFSLLPPILGNSGLVLTDLPLVMMLPGLVYFIIRWLQTPRLWLALLCGVCVALCILSKFSSLMLVPLGALTLLAWYVKPAPENAPKALLLSKAGIGHIMLAAGAMCFTLWAAYFFDVGKPRDSIPPVAAAYDTLPGSLQSLADARILPAPKLFEGIFAAKLKNEKKHAGYVLGKLHSKGVWYFFPVALGVKTPLAFLLLFAIGAFCFARTLTREKAITLSSLPLMLSIVWLASLLLIDVNAGLRHALFLYPFMAIIAATGLHWLWTRNKTATSFLATCLIIASITAHPRYMAWFNLIGRWDPSYFLVASDLDYGQDVPYLADYIADNDIQDIQVCAFGAGYTLTYYLNKRDTKSNTIMRCDKPETDTWFAASYLSIKSVNTHALSWLADYTPVAKAGDAILIYRIN